MRYFTPHIEEFDTYKICFLVPEIREKEIKACYIDPHLQGEEENILVYDLFKGPKKTPAAIQKEYLATELLPTLRNLEVEYLVVCDAEYFRTLTKNQGPEANLGYVLESQGHWKDEDKEIHSFEGFKVTYCPNYAGVFHDEIRTYAGIDIAMKALKDHALGTYTKPGSNIVHQEFYPDTVDYIDNWLQNLLEMDCDLTSDIEAFSLKHYDAGVGTITFCWNQHEGIAFGVDLIEGPDGMPVDRPEEDSRAIRQMLRDFFKAYARSGRRLIWHHISYDAYVLIYQLFMKDILDTYGLLEGLEIMLPEGGWEDTKHISYLATNSTVGNKLGLKDQSQEFAGNYAVDEIKNIRLIPFKKLLRYNLVDGLATWFTYNKNYPKMVQDDQLEIYETLFKPSTVDIIQMQLTGLPMDMSAVKALDKELKIFSKKAVDHLRSNTLVDAFLHQKRLKWIQKENLQLKTIKRTMSDARKKVSFNPASPDDLKEILYGEDFMDLPVIDLTDTKEASTGGDTLEKLRNHTDVDEVIEFIDALIDFKAVDKLITSFLPRFLEAYRDENGWHWLFGNFNLGGTVSGRLSSSGPNLQNLPANGYWAKKVKTCFKAPPGYLLIGLDFASLEDRISALQTNDPEKLKVYIDGFDGHCLRAYSYFGEQMPDIDGDTVEGINSIKKLYEPLRNESKTPTFLLTYAGTWRGIMDQMGWTKEKSQAIEEKYHDLYTVSDAWVAAQIEQATQDGFVTCAFGLRVRTPILGKTVLGTRRTPYEAQQEARTAGNALGQSYNMLNSRAANEFMGKVRKSPHSLDIRPCAHIHDAQYFVIPNDMATILYVNEHLVEAVKWQEDPAIQHPIVKLGGELSVFFPSWNNEMEIPNNASPEKIKEVASEHWEKYC
jgi:DNA polymerase-1